MTESKNGRVLIVDPLSERGHINFNIQFEKLISSFDLSWIVCERDVEFYLGVKVVERFKERLINKQNRLLYFFGQSYILLNVLFFCIKTKHDKVVLLSYELPSLSIASHLYRLFHVKLYLVEHNTFVPKSKFKNCLFRFISPKACHICLAPYIADVIFSKFGREAIGIWHPVPSVRNIKEDIKVNRVFMPSTTIGGNISSEIYDTFLQSSRYELYAKGEGLLFKDTNVHMKTFFDNYFELLYSSFCVVIPQNFDYRVSGVFFEAISGGAILAVSDCTFGREMKKAFPERVLIVTNWTELPNMLDRLPKHSFLTTEFDDKEHLNAYSSSLLCNAFNILS